MSRPLHRRDRMWIAAAIAISAVSAAIFGGVPAYATAGPVAAYGFDEGAGGVASDATGNGATALLVGAAWTTDGKFGGALEFDGAGSRVTVIDDTPLLRMASATTLEAWVRPSTSSSAWGDVIYKGNDAYFLMATSYPGGAPAAGGTFGDANSVAFGTAPLPIGVWSHLAATYDGAAVRLYVNGVLASSRVVSGEILASTYTLQIGGDSLYRQFFAGTIDEVRVYDRALTPAEIQADMDAPVVTPVADAGPPTTPGAPTAAAFGGMEIRLSWPPSIDDVGVTGYVVERCRGEGCADFLEVGSSPEPSYDDVGLALSTLYSYRVRAADAAGNASANSSVASARTASSPAVPGLVAAYAFDEETGTIAGDASGMGNDGLVTNATWTGAGRFGGALSFNGTDAWVTVDDAPSLHLTTGMTLEAWVDPLVLPALDCETPNCSWMDVIFKETDRYYIDATSYLNQQPESGGTLESGKHVLFAPAVLATDRWTHLAATYDGATFRFYVDGEVVASFAETAPLTVSSSPLRIGGDATYGQYFNGTIDEVRVYDRALTAAEIRGDMNAAIAGLSHPTPILAGLAPDTVPTGSPAFTLTVEGTGFIPESVVGWRGADRPTTYVGPTEVRAQIPASDVASAGTAQVTVYNPPPIGGTSAALPFVICSASTEVCNGVDDDCDGLIDDADPSVTGRPLWYRDGDGDGYGDAGESAAACALPEGHVAVGGDCDDADGSVWAVPGEAGSLEFVDPTTLRWTAAAPAGGTAIAYDTLRADAPDAFDAAGTCLESGGPDTSSLDASVPGPGAAFFYLVRAVNACGAGSLGTTSSGSERIAGACP